MNRTTKFTQTKFKDHPPPPVPTKIIKRYRKRCAPPVPDGETSESGTSEDFEPPPPPPVLKDFLIDIAQEVVNTKPVDVIDHLAAYTQSLHRQLIERQEEENALRKRLEENVKRLKLENRASRVIQMAYRGFKVKQMKKRSTMLLHDHVIPGITLEQANKAAACIQRNYRKHGIHRRVQIKLARDREEVSPYISLQKKKKADSMLRLLKNVNLSDHGGDTVKELYGPNTPFNPDGESFGVDPPCHMAAPLLANQSKNQELAANVTSNESVEIPDSELKACEEGTTTEPKDIGVPSGEMVEEGATGDAAEEEVQDNYGAEESSALPSPEHSDGSLPREASEEKNEEASVVPEETPDTPPQPSAEEPPSGEEAKQDEAAADEAADTDAAPEDNEE